MVVNGLSVITGIKFAEDTIKSLNNLTFLYNPNFNADTDVTKSSGVYFPISFFYVVKCTESYASDVSSKPLLFYNSQSSESSATSKASILQVIADNLVIKPKKYTLDVIIPFTNDKPINSRQIYSWNTVVNTVSLLQNNTAPMSFISATTDTILLYQQFIEAILGESYNVSHTDNDRLEKLTNLIIHEEEYNKVSLEEMFNSRSILKMKMWNGWRYRYVVMTSLDIDKEPTEEGVYRGKIVCQELPILTLRKNAGTKVALSLGKLAKKRIDNIDRLVNSKEIKDD